MFFPCDITSFDQIKTSSDCCPRVETDRARSTRVRLYQDPGYVREGKPLG